MLALAILLTICQAIRAEYNVDAYCTLVSNGVRLGSLDSCETYYTCMNGRATMSTCDGGLAYDKNAQSCKPKSDVNCFYGVEEPCQGRDKAFVPIMNTCNGYIYCENNAESSRGQCPMKTVFKNGQCVYGDCDDNINTGEAGGQFQTVCQIVPNDIFFGSTFDCQIWQKCIKDELKDGVCPPDFVFDVQNKNCNYESGSMCSRVTGIDIQPDPPKSEPCTGEPQNARKADRRKCSVYYECDGTNWMPRSCGANMFYSIVSNKCEFRQAATPHVTCDRCEFSRNQFVNSVDPDCRGYQVCKNGVRVNAASCGLNYYFDESIESCVEGRNVVPDYAYSNGACIDCKKLCATQPSTDCANMASCNCAPNGNVCESCPGGIDPDTKKCLTCDDICTDLTKDTCKIIGDCACGLSPTDQCVLCDDGVGDNKYCIECDKICADMTDCQPDGNCNCGLTAATNGDCEICDGNVDPATKVCETCVEICQNIQDLTECKPSIDCECALTDSSASATCEECASGVIGDNNICDETCADTCALIIDPAECKPETGTLECNCGLSVAGGTDCEECAEIVNSDGACETCADFCGGITDMADCVSTPPCNCEEDASDPGTCIVGS